MCGIHGQLNLSNVLNNKFGQFIKDGFVAGSLRGMDSSGIFQLDRKWKPYMHKRAIAGPDFVHTKMADRYFKDTEQSRITVAHVRHATSGKVEEDNAHPFQSETPDNNWVVGVHNGTLVNWKHKPGAKDYDVDSEWAISHIAANGLDAFKDFDGAYCFVWWDGRKKDRLFMARNSSRPMNIRMSKNKEQLYFASEAGMLAWLTERNDLTVEQDVLILDVGQIYEFDLSGKEITWTKTATPTRPAVATTTSTSTSGSTTNQAAIVEAKVMEAFLERIKKAASTSRDLIQLEITELEASRKGKSRKQAVTLTGELVAAASTLEDETDIKESRALVPLADTVVATVEKTQTATERAIAETEAAFEDELPFGRTDGSIDDDTINEWVAPDDWYSTKNATISEQETAEFHGILGEVQWLEGLMYDPDTGELWGEIRDFVSGQGHVNYPCVLRGMTASVADRCYIGNEGNTLCGKAGEYVIVIGMYNDRALGRTFVAAELTDKGRKELYKKMH